MFYRNTLAGDLLFTALFRARLRSRVSLSVGARDVGIALVLVGYLGPLDPMLNTVPLILGRKSVAGSLIGGIAETQEMLNFCGEHGITSDIEMIKMQEINLAYERMLKSDVKYRFVIDLASLNATTA